jgi:hypothetical protein
MREPQLPQKAHFFVAPLSPFVVQYVNLPERNSMSSRFIHSDIPKALDDCFWQ